jgi:hypothetical protein
MHTQKTFTFTDKKGNAVEFISRPYTMALEETFINCVGAEAWNHYQATGQVQLDLSVNKMKRDFAKLLQRAESIEHREEQNPNAAAPCSMPHALSQVDWHNTPIDVFASVYFFFMQFKNSVFITLQQELNKQQLLNIREMAEVLNLIPENILRPGTEMSMDSGE